MHITIYGTPSFVLDVVVVRPSRLASSMRESDVGTSLKYYTYICAVLEAYYLQTKLMMSQRDVTRSCNKIIISFGCTDWTGLNRKTTRIRKNSINKGNMRGNKIGMIAQMEALCTSSPRLLQLAMSNKFSDDRNDGTFHLKPVCQCMLLRCSFEIL